MESNFPFCHHFNLKLIKHKLRLKFIASFIQVFAVLFISGTVIGQIVPTEWKFESQRQEIAPNWYVDSMTTYNNNPTLALAGGGKDYADGRWFNIVQVEPGEYFKFRASFITSKVEEPKRSILARILWLNALGKSISYAEYPVTLFDKANDGWSIIEQSYLVPKTAKKAKIELQYRWDADGIVHFGDVSFKKTIPLKPRMVRLSTINFRPKDSKSSQENLLLFSQKIAMAATQKADIVCLPEGITMVGTDLTYVSASESVPGPTTQLLGNLARKYNLYIVAGILEKQGDIIYNTAVLIDRKGNLAGKYRKVSLPMEEIEGGVTPGDSLPVFDTDFGRIGLMICWDVFFPETARTLAKKGAEVIFLPIWGGNINLAKARAIENQVFLVSSSYDMKTAVFDQAGDIIKEATKTDPVITVNVDLNKQRLWQWLGDFKNRIPREMPSQKAVGN